MKPREVIETLQADEAKRARAKAAMRVPVEDLRMFQQPTPQSKAERRVPNTLSPAASLSSLVALALIALGVALAAMMAW
jgi:hypothetical protein